MLDPNVERAFSVDRKVRERLAGSLDYLDGVLGHSGLGELSARVRQAPVSPFVFCLYSRLVAALSHGDRDGARETADSLHAAGQYNSDAVVPYLDESLPDAWWSAFHALLDTEPGRDFRPVAPSAAGLGLFQRQCDAAFDIMAQCDPDLREEVAVLVRMIVPAAPRDSTQDQRFNGASTFLAWGATILNSEVTRHPIAMADLLVHESGHLLLFGLAEGAALTRNAPTERYSSPLRRDPRPIDGIFHACFVATRVHLALSRMIDSGRLDEDSRQIAIELAEKNGRAAASGLAVLNQHAKVTDKGAPVLAAMNSFWSSGAGH